jgi:hypothetical protein
MCERDELRAIVRTDALLGRAHVRANSVDGDAEFLGDLFVATAPAQA